jgi:hypothetical protein
MGAARRNLQAEPKILKNIETPNLQIYQSEQTFSQKKYVSSIKSVKEPKIRMGVCKLGQNLQAKPKFLKK